MVNRVWLEGWKEGATHEERNDGMRRDRTGCFPYPHPPQYWIMMLRTLVPTLRVVSLVKSSETVTK
jgi:hypothetical protein